MADDLVKAPQESKDLETWSGEDVSIVSTLADPKKTIAALNSAAPIGDNLGKRIDLVHLVGQEAEILDEATGIYQPVRRTILIDKNGAAFAATSEGIIQSLKLVLGLVKRTPPFDPPLAIVVNQKNTRHGRRVYVVDLA